MKFMIQPKKLYSLMVVMKMIVSDVMTTDPVAINMGALLKDALMLMEDRESQISVLPVVNGDGKSCAGLLRLHDIYQTNLF